MENPKTRKRVKRLFWGTLIFLISFTIASTGAFAAQPVKIGAALGLTGMWTDWCRKNVIAANMAVEEVNVEGGINGHPLEIVIYDTSSKPTEAARIVRKLASDDRVLSIVGPFSSSECEVAFPVGNRLKITMISQASSKPGIGAANRPYAFRNKVDEFRLAIPAAKKFIQAYGIKKVVVVHDVKDAIGRVLGMKILPGVFKKMGVPTVNMKNPATYQTGDFDMAPQVTKLKGLDFDGVIFGGVYMDAVTFMKEFRRQGMKQPMMGGNPLLSEYFPVRGGEAVEGVYSSATFFAGMPGMKVKRFVEEFSKRAKKKGYKPPAPVQMDVAVYDAIHLLAQIMKEEGITGDRGKLEGNRTKIMERLTTTKDFPGLAGKIAFNKNGDGVKDIYVVKVQGGKWVVVD